MFFTQKMSRLSLVSIVVYVAVLVAPAHSLDTGYQVIDGTRVYTQVDHENQRATFSNDCGTQTISRSALQAGAKPTNIIPCPRPKDRETSRDSERDTPRTSPQTNSGELKWGALAAGLQSGNPSRVSVGSALNYDSAKEASSAAVRNCEKNGVSCSSVGTFTGCGYITLSKGADNVAWGAGPTAQSAYNNCYRKVQGGNCDPQTIGGCNKN